jgi:hypothetical protein
MKRVVVITTILAVLLVLVSASTATAGPGKWVTGYVNGSNEGTVVLSGAKVTVRLNSLAPNFDAKYPTRNIIGVAYTDRYGRYLVDVSRWHWFGLPVGSYIEVSAITPGYLTVLQWGKYSSPHMRVDFTGAARLPVDEGQWPPLPIDW